MGSIGFGSPRLAAAFVVEVDHEPGIAREGFWRAHFFHFVAFPQAVGVAEGAQAAVGADAGAGEDDDFLHGLLSGEWGCRVVSGSLYGRIKAT